jgi:hypothetical protein
MSLIYRFLQSSILSCRKRKIVYTSSTYLENLPSDRSMCIGRSINTKELNGGDTVWLGAVPSLPIREKMVNAPEAQLKSTRPKNPARPVPWLQLASGWWSWWTPTVSTGEMEKRDGAAWPLWSLPCPIGRAVGGSGHGKLTAATAVALTQKQ